jgi:hypothetical protein
VEELRVSIPQEEEEAEGEVRGVVGIIEEDKEEEGREWEDSMVNDKVLITQGETMRTMLNKNGTKKASRT